MAGKRTKVHIKADKKHFKSAYVKTKKINRSQAMTTGGIRF